MRTRFAKRLMTIGTVITAVTMLISVGTASATPPNPPTTGVGPRFYSTIGLQQMRSAGSETTYYMMAALGNLYTQSSIYGCVLSSVDERTCTSTVAIDPQDDWSRDEYTNGAGVGSGGGIAQLCGVEATGGGTASDPNLPVDFARSSRALKSGDFAGACTSSNLIAENYADDAVNPVDFQSVGLTSIGGTAACTAAEIPADLINGTCELGPLAAGWEPGNSLGGPYTGTAFNNMTTVGGNASLIEQIYCTTDTTRITDWGQLTNLSGSETPGQGAPIGVPIYIPFVNTASGTYSTWNGIAGGCTTDNAASPDGQTVQENDAPQISDIAHNAATALTKRWPDFNNTPSDPLLTSGSTADYVFTNNEIAATLYFISLGVSIWQPYTAKTSVPDPCGAHGQVACADPVASSTALSVDNVTNSPACDIPEPLGKQTCFDNNGNQVTDSNSARKLYNVVRTDTLRGSVAGFLNYICDAQDPSASSIYGTDLTTGTNYAAEVVGTIGTTFAFPYVPCTTSGGVSTAPFVGPGLTPPSGGAAIANTTLLGT